MNVRKVDFKSSNANEAFRDSLLESGFAIIENHPIPKDLILDSFKNWNRFFESNQKAEFLYDRKTQAGYFPYQSENAKDSPHKDLKEFFHYYRDSRLPEVSRKETLLLFQALDEMGTQLLNWIDETIPENIKNFFSMPLSEMSLESPDTLLRPIYYPPLSGNEEPGAVRAAAHEDINLITLLPAATAPGLQARDLAGNWITVECDPGTIVINSGDMLKEASRGYFPSTTHRVMNPEAELVRAPRLSMPLFVHPNKNVRLSDSYTAGEYLEERLREIGLLDNNESIM